MRENWNLRKMEKLRQKELDRQRQEEAERFQKMLDDPMVSREDALAAARVWIDKWMDDWPKISGGTMEGGGLAGGNARFPPLEQATRRAWGNLLTLACLGESRGDSPPASLADNDCQACMAVQVPNLAR